MSESAEDSPGDAGIDEEVPPEVESYYKPWMSWIGLPLALVLLFGVLYIKQRFHI